VSDTFIILDEPSVTDKKLDAENVDGGSPPLVRERIQITGSALAEVARVENAAPAATDYGLVVRVLDQPVAGGGHALPTHIVTTGANNEKASLKGSAGQLYRVSIYNGESYPIFVKFHNTAGVPTPGTTAVVLALGVDAGLHRDFDAPKGIAFGTGIGITVTKLVADTDATQVGTNSVIDVFTK
jgi:hypothetical protein